MGRILTSLTAAGTAHTNSTDETVLSSYTIPANALQAGKVYLWSGAVRATATNSTDTLTCKLYLGATTLTTAVHTGAAIDVANGDQFVWQVWLHVQADGSAGVISCSGHAMGPDADGTAGTGVQAHLTSVDTTADLLLEVSGDWSVANAGNSCQAEAFTLIEYP